MDGVSTKARGTGKELFPESSRNNINLRFSITFPVLSKHSPVTLCFSLSSLPSPAPLLFACPLLSKAHLHLHLHIIISHSCKDRGLRLPLLAQILNLNGLVKSRLQSLDDERYQHVDYALMRL